MATQRFPLVLTTMGARKDSCAGCEPTEGSLPTPARSLYEITLPTGTLLLCIRCGHRLVATLTRTAMDTE